MKKLFELSKRIQALSEIGIHYSYNTFDKERYKELQQISIRILEVLTNEPFKKIELSITEKNNYKTPKVDIRAVVFNKQKEILMVKEKIDGLWSLPVGWADVGYSPSEIAEKEAQEEAGISVKAKRILAVLDKKCHGHPEDINYVYKIFILCEKVNNTLKSGNETDDVAFFSEDKLPPLSLPRNTKNQISMMFEFARGERNEVYFD